MALYLKYRLSDTLNIINMTAEQRTIIEQRIRDINDRQTITLMISYLIAIVGAFMVIAFV